VSDRYPSKKSRLLAQLLTLALVAANLVAFNAILSPWASARIDLTRDRSFSISPATRKILTSLDDDLTIIGYFSKRTHPKLAPLVPQIEDLLDEYRAVNRKRVHIEIDDPSENDRLAQEANDRYGVSSTPFRLASKYESGIVNAYFALVVKYGNQYVRYGFDDLIDVEPQPDGDVEVRLRNLEYDLTRAIKKVVYEFRGAGELFDRIGKPVRLTAVWTPERLPPALASVPAEVRKAAADLKKTGGDRFTFEEIVPADAAQEADVSRRFGARPLTMGLFSNDKFYLQAFLSVGDHMEQIPIASGRVAAAGLRERIEASLKRQAPGFLKTVGVAASAPTLPPEVMMQYRMQGQMPPVPPPEFEQLKSRLREDYNVVDVTLGTAEGVPGNVDVLLVLKPRSLSDRAVYDLDQYLMRGGRVILCAGAFDPQFSQNGLTVVPANSGLDAWLKHYGIEISKTLLLDDRNQPLPIPEIRRTPFGLIQTWAYKPYPYLVQISDAGLKSRAITARLDAVGIYWGSPIEVAPPADKKLQVTPILASSDRSWTDDNTADVSHVTYTVPSNAKSHLVSAALQGSFDSYYAGQPAPFAPGDSTAHEAPIPRSPETRLVVVGDAEFVSDMVARALGQQSADLFAQNLGFLQNVVDWMNVDDDLVAIRTRASAARPIRRLSPQAAMSLETANYLIPLAVLVAFGISRFWRRRRVRPVVELAPTAPPPGAALPPAPPSPATVSSEGGRAT
jgi:ABC-2 type transport system permease protein